MYKRQILDLLQSDALNLNGHTLGQLVNGNTAASRLVNEELLVGGVHFGEVGHVSEEDLDIVLVRPWDYSTSPRNPRVILIIRYDSR